jgi:translation elongation factor EF-Ts
MITIEQVEKLRKYTGVSYTLAKEALEETDGDLLEAVILLEKQQKLQPQSEKSSRR